MTALADNQPTLEAWTAYHGMFCSVGTSRACGQAINGKVLFWDTEKETAAVKEFSSPISTAGYWAMVAMTGTGLSGAFACTETLASVEVPLQAWGNSAQLSAARIGTLPSSEALAFHDVPCPPWLLERLVALNHGQHVQLVRRFEYMFKLVGLRVVMLHFITLAADGSAKRDADGNPELHLVEVFDWQGVNKAKAEAQRSDYTAIITGAMIAAAAGLTVGALMLRGRT